MTNRMPFIYQIATENDESSEVANFPIIFAQRIITVCIRDGTEKPKKTHAKTKCKAHTELNIQFHWRHTDILDILTQFGSIKPVDISLGKVFAANAHQKLQRLRVEEKLEKNGEHTMHNCE